MRRSNSQSSVPAVLMRGGTSKGVFLHNRDLPDWGSERDTMLLRIMGSPDPMQIDGLGGTYSSTSKVVIVEPSITGADVDYWFGQVSILDPMIDWAGNCGNLTTAVGPFAIDEGLVPAQEPITNLRLRNRNTGVIVEVAVPVTDGRAEVSGSAVVSGVPGTGAPIVSLYRAPAGGVLGSLLPTGCAVDVFDTSFGSVAVSVVDAVHPYAFASASSFGLKLSDCDPAALNTDPSLLDRFEELRARIAVRLGRATSTEAARLESPVIPRLMLIEQSDGEGVDLVTLTVSLQKVHRAIPLTGALCCAAAVKVPGSIPQALLSTDFAGDAITLRHPRGTITVTASADPHTASIDSVGVVSTARRLFEGRAYVR